jgi:hypothetical protein
VSNNVESVRPISAPAGPRRPTGEYRQIEREELIEEDLDQEYPPVTATASVTRYRDVMRVSDKTDYRHYYTMPAAVGIRNVPSLVDEMIREGVTLRNIVIDFEQHVVEE